MPSEEEAVKCCFIFTKVSYYCIDRGGISHEHHSTTSRVEMPEDIETLPDAIRWLDAERKKSERFRCKSCGSGGFVWYSLQLVACAVITVDYSHQENHGG